MCLEYFEKLLSLLILTLYVRALNLGFIRTHSLTHVRTHLVHILYSGTLSRISTHSIILLSNPCIYTVKSCTYSGTFTFTPLCTDLTHSLMHVRTHSLTHVRTLSLTNVHNTHNGVLAPLLTYANDILRRNSRVYLEYI